MRAATPSWEPLRHVQTHQEKDAEDEPTGECLRLEGVDIEQHKQIGDAAEYQRSHYRVEDAALAASEASSADHDSRDRGEFV